MDQGTLQIAIYRSVGIGDAVLATSCMDLIERIGISSQVYWLGREPVLSMIVSAFPGVIPVPIESDRGHWANFRTVTNLIKRVDIVVDLQKSARSQLLCHHLAMRNRVRAYTWDKGSLRRSLLVLGGIIRGRRRILPNSNSADSRLRHVMMANCLKKALIDYGVSQKSSVAEVTSSPTLPTHHLVSRQEWRACADSRMWLGVGVGALHPGKEAPMEVFRSVLVRVADLVTKKEGAAGRLGLVFLGDEYARIKTMELIESLPIEIAVKDLTGRTSLSDAAGVLSEVAGFLTNDSALGHICQAVGTPAAVLFGPTVEAFGYAPFQEDSRAFSAALGCRPCTKDGDAHCRYGDRRCFTLIDAEKVAAHLLQCMNGKAEQK